MDIKEFIFNTYKDQAVMGKTFKRDIIKKYHIEPSHVRDIYVKINNYQIKKYGERLTLDKNILPSYSAQELDQMRRNSNARKNQRRNNER